MTHGLLRRLAAAGLAMLVPIALGAGQFAERAAAVPITAILVNTTSDLVDPGDGTCSLRAAIQAADVGGHAGNCIGGAGENAISFSLGGGVPAISVGSALPAVTQPVIIDGNTGGATRVEIHGSSAWNGLVLQSSAAGSSINGLKIDGFSVGMLVSGDNVTVAGNVLVSNATYGLFVDASGDTIGGSNPTPSSCSAPCNLVQDNATAGLFLEGGGGTVEGNFIGTTAAGTAAKANGEGILANGGPWTIGGTTAGERNLISGNAAAGIHSKGCDCTIEGNYIGTTVTGKAALPNGTGITVESSVGMIGGAATGAGNLISGNAGSGIEAVQSTSFSPVSVRGNLIGTSVTGTALGNGDDGITVAAASGVAQQLVVGTVSAGDGNEIAHNRLAGIHVSGSNADGDEFRGNSIHDNGGKGISLSGGANGSIAAPAITGTAPVHGTTCANCLVDVYSDSADEGRVYEGTATADGSGNWTYPGTVGGPNVTATATSASHQTSQFSTAVALPKPYQPDGRIRKGSGAFIGNNIYNTAGVNQTKTASKAPGTAVTFGISIQNDSSSSDHMLVGAIGTTVSGYKITYFHGTTNITAAVVAGTFQTPALAPGGTYLIKAKVKVTSSAPGGSSVTRLVLLTSAADGTRQDAVKFTVSRK